MSWASFLICFYPCPCSSVLVPSSLIGSKGTNFHLLSKLLKGTCPLHCCSWRLLFLGSLPVAGSLLGTCSPSAVQSWSDRIQKAKFQTGQWGLQTVSRWDWSQEGPLEDVCIHSGKGGGANGSPSGRVNEEQLWRLLKWEDGCWWLSVDTFIWLTMTSDLRFRGRLSPRGLGTEFFSVYNGIYC